MTKKLAPKFDKSVPFPITGRPGFYDPHKAYSIRQPHFPISYLLSVMQVGESFLASNYATTSVNYAQKKHGYRYKRQLQVDGSVRIWRIK